MFEMNLQLFGGGGSSSGLGAGGGGGGGGGDGYYVFQLTRPNGTYDYLPVKAKDKGAAQKKADKYAKNEGYKGKAKASKREGKYTKDELEAFKKKGSRVIGDL